MKEEMLELDEGQFGLTGIHQMRSVKDVDQINVVVYMLAAIEGTGHKGQQWSVRLDDGQFDTAPIAEATLEDVALAHEAGEWLIALLRARQ